MNVANNVVTIPKKPEGYVYADFMSPKCFLTLYQLNALNSYVPVKRNSGDDLPTFYFVSSKYYGDAVTALGTNLPAAKTYDLTDDFLAQALFRVVDYLTGKQDAGRTNSQYLLGKIASTKSYQTGILNKNIQYNLETVAPNLMGYLLAKDHFDALQAAILVGPPVDEIQTVEFDAVPDTGSFTLIYDGNETNPINFDALAAVVQTELQAVGMTSAVVTGDFTAGFNITVSGLGNVTELLVGTNALEAATIAVNITVTTAQEGN
jgi:hypothetical protein